MKISLVYPFHTPEQMKRNLEIRGLFTSSYVEVVSPLVEASKEDPPKKLMNLEIDAIDRSDYVVVCTDNFPPAGMIMLGLAYGWHRACTDREGRTSNIITFSEHGHGLPKFMLESGLVSKHYTNLGELIASLIPY